MVGCDKKSEDEITVESAKECTRESDIKHVKESKEANSKEHIKGYKQVFKQKEYTKLIIANVINRFGDSIDSVALAWLVYTLTSSASWSAIIFGFNRVPTIFLQPFAGALVERMNKKAIMIITDIIRGVCVSLIAVLLILKLLNPWIILLLTLVISSAEAFRNPASSAILPKILDKSNYEFGISLNSTLSSVIELIGLGLAGAIIALLGIQTAIFIDAITFWGSAMVIALINSKEEKPVDNKINIKEYFDTLKGGFIYIKSKRIILNFVILAMVSNAILIPINSLMAPLVTDILKQGEYMLSILSFFLTIGLVIGSAIYPYIGKRYATRVLIFIGGIALSIYYFLLATCSYLTSYVIMVYVICIISSILTGLAMSLMIAALNVQFMKQVDPDYMARAGAILSAGCVSAMPVTSFFISGLTKLISLTSILYGISIIALIFFMFVYVRKVKFE
jgi:Na+/melibiose symporter-like transporter